MGAVGYGLIGNASAMEATDATRVVVGTESTLGVQMCHASADNVEQELDFGTRGKAVVGQFSQETVAELASRSEVRYVEPDIEVRALGQPSASAEELPWGINRVDADVVHEKGVTGEGAHIAILDTGIDADHPDLAPNLGEGYAVERCNRGCREDWDDDHSHGTHCAGIAAAVDNRRGVVGVAPDATLHSVKVLSGEGSGSASGVAEGIMWAADQGHDVISMSLGATQGSSIIRDALRYAQDRGCVIVAAAGNDGPCIDCVHYPGAYPEAIAVGSINRFDDLSEFSSTGDEVEIVAPGTSILSTIVDGEYRSYSGTSMATPHVAGAAALLMAQGLSAEETRQKLRETAEDLGLRENESGSGLLNVDKAVDEGVSDPEPQPFGVATRQPTDVTQTSATIRGVLTGMGDYENATVGFELWTEGDREGTSQTFETGERGSAGNFSQDLDGLSEGTTYQYVATAEAPDGTTVSGSVMTLSPQKGVAVETLEPTDVTTDSATLVGRVTDLAGNRRVRVGHRCWVRGDREATLVESRLETVRRPETVRAEVSGLEPDREYVAVVYAETDDGEVVGKEVGFRTEEVPTGPFSIRTLPADWIGDHGAMLNGEVTDMGNVREIETAFVYWPKGNRSAAIEEDAEDVDEPDDFDELVMFLDPATTYEFVAVGYDSRGRRVVGNVEEFTTTSD